MCKEDAKQTFPRRGDIIIGKAPGKIGHDSTTEFISSKTWRNLKYASFGGSFSSNIKRSTYGIYYYFKKENHLKKKKTIRAIN